MAAAELGAELTALVAQGLLVEDIERRAELAGQIEGVAAGDGQMTLVVGRRGEGQDARQGQLDGRSLLGQGKNPSESEGIIRLLTQPSLGKNVEGAGGLVAAGDLALALKLVEVGKELNAGPAEKNRLSLSNRSPALLLKVSLVW